MRLTRAIVAAFIALPLLAFAAMPIQDLPNVPVPVKADGSNYTDEEVRTAIIAACRKRGWTPRLDGASRLTAAILVRSKHYAEIEIVFDPSAYSIRYLSSRNLDYDEADRRIHRNYNKWVAQLSQSIQREFGVHSQMY